MAILSVTGATNVGIISKQAQCYIFLQASKSFQLLLKKAAAIESD